MSATTKRATTTASLLLAALALALLTGLASRRERVDREITLVARDMAYWLGEQKNPDIVVAPGETVRVRLVNKEPGVEHDFVAPALGLRTRLLDHGETDSVVLRGDQLARRAADGPLEYRCSLHPVLMRGRLAPSPTGQSAPSSDR